MDNVFNLLVVVLFGTASLLALFAALALLLPAPIKAVRAVLERSSGRSLLLGLVNFLFFGLLATLGVWLAERVGGLPAAVFVLVSAVIALAVAVLTLLGLLALADLLGSRIGGPATQFNNMLRGGGLLLLAALAPYLGWFLFAPLASWTGLGASIQALVLRRKPAPESQA